jgi:hypothetical protein
VRITLFGSYACAVTRSMWLLVEALEGTLGNSIDVRFGHVLVESLWTSEKRERIATVAHMITVTS